MNFALHNYETPKNKHVEIESRICLTYSAGNNQSSSKIIVTGARGPYHTR